MKARERWLLALLLSPAVLALALHAREVARWGLAEPTFYVSAPESGEAYPRVTGFRLDLSAPPSELRVGDRLRRIGGKDARGLGHFGVDAVTLAEADEAGRVELVYERGGVERSTAVELGRAALPWGRVIPLSAMLLVCVFVIVRAPPGTSVRFFFVVFVVTVIFQAQFHGPNPWQTLLSKSLFYALGAIAPPLLVTWGLLFPPEAPRPRPALLALPWLLAPAFGIPRASYLLGGPVPPELVPQAINLAHLAFAAAALAAVTWNYRRSPPVGRRRVKWVLWSIWLGLLPMLLHALLVATEFGRSWYPATAPWTKLSLLALPIGLLFAMQRQSLFDVDRVLGATATYTLLLGFAALAMLLVVPPAASAASDLVGLSASSVQLSLSTALALGLLPLQTVVRPRIDRVFFPERAATAVRAKALLEELATGSGEERALEQSGEAVAAAFGASTALVYARRSAGFELLGEQRPSAETLPHRFEDAHPLIAILRALSGPIAAGGSRELSGLPPLERAALEMLGAQLVAPLRTPEGLVGFLCLGPRRSGDIYTATDVLLVDSVAANLALRLLHAQERSLRQYVPDAVRSRIDERTELAEAEEREVSILFVDIRGYTSRVARSEASEVFEALNRYTTRVSEIVRMFGGQVVEFHGDGLMAVFGAPAALPAKERSAVQAACEIVAALAAADGGALASVGEGSGLDVGVGVATGTAFVGNIRAVDRLIWSAIGTTTNLAARLQALTRELEASICIDAATREGAGSAGDGFTARPRTTIRGMPQPIDVHTLGR